MQLKHKILLWPFFMIMHIHFIFGHSFPLTCKYTQILMDLLIRVDVQCAIAIKKCNIFLTWLSALPPACDSCLQVFLLSHPLHAHTCDCNRRKTSSVCVRNKATSKICQTSNVKVNRIQIQIYTSCSSMSHNTKPDLG